MAEAGTEIIPIINREEDYFTQELLRNLCSITSDGRVKGVEIVVRKNSQVEPESLYVFEFSYDEDDPEKKAYWYIPKKQEIYGKASEEAERFFRRIWLKQGGKLTSDMVDEQLAEQLKTFFSNFRTNEAFADDTGIEETEQLAQGWLNASGAAILGMIKDLVGKTIDG